MFISYSPIFLREERDSMFAVAIKKTALYLVQIVLSIIGKLINIHVYPYVLNMVYYVSYLYYCIVTKCANFNKTVYLLKVKIMLCFFFPSFPISTTHKRFNY